MSKNAAAIFQKLGDQTQNPFWTLAMNNAVPVKVNSSKGDLVIAHYGKLVDGKEIPSLQESKAMAFGLAIDVPLRIVRYVEGLVIHDGKVFQHAWVNVFGRYFDPIFEQINSGFNPRRWKVGRQYFALAEIEFQDKKDAPNVKHCMNMEWGIDFDETGELLFEGEPIQNILQQVYTPVKEKGIWLVQPSE